MVFVFVCHAHAHAEFGGGVNTFHDSLGIQRNNASEPLCDKFLKHKALVRLMSSMLDGSFKRFVLKIYQF